jgi:hypothetical protein
VILIAIWIAEPMDVSSDGIGRDKPTDVCAKRRTDLTESCSILGLNPWRHKT